MRRMLSISDGFEGIYVNFEGDWEFWLGIFLNKFEITGCDGVILRIIPGKCVRIKDLGCFTGVEYSGWLLMLGKIEVKKIEKKEN
jgi:hypothetical protein